MAGVNSPGALVLGDLQSTTSVAIGRGGAVTVDNSAGPPGSITLQGVAVAMGGSNFGTNPLTCGAVTCGAVTSPGALNLGSNTLACGAITSAGALSLGSNSVACGAVTASGDVTYPRYDITVGFATPSSAQSISNGALTSISWTTKVSGGGIAFSNPTTTFTIPVAGWYALTCSLPFQANATGVRTIWFYINGGAVQIADRTVNAVSGEKTRLSIFLQYQFAASDTVAVRVYQTSGGALSVGNDGSPPTLSITRLHE